VKLFLHL